jgi:hypothetical protein
VVALAALFVLPACGGDDGPREPASDFGKQTVAEISSAARSDMAGVRSLTIDGTVKDQTFHISLADDGTCVGTVEQYGGTAEVIETVEGSYVRADKAYWLGTVADQGEKGKKKIDQLEAKAGDRWIRTPRRVGYFLPQCDFENFVPVLTSGDAKLATKGEEREIDGQLAVALTADQSAVTSTIWIATEAPHRVLELSEAGLEKTTLRLSNFDEPLDITTPQPDEVFDLEAANKKAE